MLTKISCLFCEMPEATENRKYKPPKDSEYVCGRCTDRFSRMSQDALKDGIKYLENNKETLCVFNFEIIENKIKAINMFVREEYEQRKPTRYNQRAADGKRTAGAIRDKKRIPGLSQKGKAPSVS